MSMPSRAGLSTLFLAALVGLTLTAPARVAACLCGPGLGQEVRGPDDVVFTGTVIGAAPRHFFDVMSAARIYTFEVDEVVHGDPGDGRVYVRPPPEGNCGLEVQLGARYLIDADVVDPDAPFMQEVPTVPLVTSLCSDTEQLGPPNPLLIERGLGFDGLVIGLSGLALVVAVGVYVFRRRDSEVGE